MTGGALAVADADVTPLLLGACAIRTAPDPFDGTEEPPALAEERGEELPIGA